ncbi:Cof-type HAD-IIB family hydrolase [Niallia sp. FSL W8-0635]|uniref:Cof-type HAD-IIB family hydrolase n=1 Tax=Niallia sp. FSL W8-0635 TaxID=2975337 RepID=UPI0009C92202|nr:cof family hydrolase [Mycobacteroides abscessus subsp. abscessus]HEO8419165.1 HAD family phosphatase [Yersinia enterocolitica]
MITCIVTDLDGTLLNHESKISPENLESLKIAQERGIEVIIATGRNYPDVMEIFKDTGLKTWVIAANGATIHDPAGNRFDHLPMDKPKAMRLLQWLEERDYYYEIFSDDYLYSPQRGRQLIEIELDRLCTANPDISRAELEKHAVIQFSQTGFSFIDSYKEIENPAIHVYNILAFSFDKQKLDAGWETFRNDQSITLVTSGTYNFEFEHKDASKGNALVKLANHLGIALKDIVAMGDSMNDLSMLEKVGYPVAMGNAREDVKNASIEIAETNDQHGVANTIKRLVLSSIAV